MLSICMISPRRTREPQIANIAQGVVVNQETQNETKQRSSPVTQDGTNNIIILRL